jgi:hypothetical protein
MMTTYIPHTIGKVYDVAHLRKASSVDELMICIKNAHPLAAHDGSAVSLFFERQIGNYVYTVWNDDKWLLVDFDVAHQESIAKALGKKLKYDMTHFLRLAPLAIKHNPRTGKDEPLHVGDVIELKGSPNYGEPWLPHIVGAGSLIGSNNVAWRWPVEVQS